MTSQDIYYWILDHNGPSDVYCGMDYTAHVCEISITIILKLHGGNKYSYIVLTYMTDIDAAYDHENSTFRSTVIIFVR